MSGLREENAPDACPRCRAPLPEDAAECPACGPSPNGQSETAVTGEETTYTLLSAANLARMRGQWDEALQKSVEALRLDPGNSTAHSLVGDIYQDQGRREEAIQWYQMALDLDPENTADRTKLDRLIHPEVTLQPAARPPAWMRIGIPTALVLAFLMMAVGIGALITSRSPGTAVETAPGDPPPLELPPSLRLPGRRPPARNPAAAPPSSAPVAAGGETLHEARLRRSLTLRPPSPGGQVRVVSAHVDPGSHEATVTLHFRSGETLQAWEALQLAAEAASQAFRLDGYLQSVKVRVLAPVRGGAASELALIGVSSRSHAAAATSAHGFFSSLWWNPVFFPSSPASALTSPPASPQTPPSASPAGEAPSPSPSPDAPIPAENPAPAEPATAPPPP